MSSVLQSDGGRPTSCVGDRDNGHYGAGSLRSEGLEVLHPQLVTCHVKKITSSPPTLRKDSVAGWNRFWFLLYQCAQASVSLASWQMVSLSLPTIKRIWMRR